MRNFFDKAGIAFECYKRECFYDNGLFIDEAIYALFEHQWPSVKMNLQRQMAEQAS